MPRDRQVGGIQTAESESGGQVAERRIVARGFRWWHKKRGGRRTGSRLLGSLGEALFFAILFVFGVISLTALIISQFVSPVEEADGIADVDGAIERPLDGGSEGSRSPGDLERPATGATAAQAAAHEGRRLLRVVASYRTGFGFWLMTVVLSSFVLMGGSGLLYTVLHLGTSAERRAALAKRAADIDLISDALPTDKAFPTIPSDADLTNSPGIRLAYRLPTTESPAWQLTAATLFGLLWNALAIGLLVVALKSHLDGRPDWLLSLLVIPFVGVGAWSIRYFFRQLVWVTAVGPSIVEISDHPLRPGTRAQIFFSQTGHRQLQKLQLDLVCEEEANYHQGTDIRTERCVVSRCEILRREGLRMQAREPFEIEAELEVPRNAMHSFQSAHNRVRWKVQVRAEVEGLPAYERSFPIVVYPPAILVERAPLTRVEAKIAERSVRA